MNELIDRPIIEPEEPPTLRIKRDRLILRLPPVPLWGWGSNPKGSLTRLIWGVGAPEIKRKMEALGGLVEIGESRLFGGPPLVPVWFVRLGPRPVVMDGYILPFSE